MSDKKSTEAIENETRQETSLEDLPVGEASQEEVKGGHRPVGWDLKE